MRHQRYLARKPLSMRLSGFLLVFQISLICSKKCANSGTFSVKFEILVSIRLANHRAKPVLVRLSRNGLGGATVAVIEIIATIWASMRIDFLKIFRKFQFFACFAFVNFFLHGNI